MIVNNCKTNQRYFFSTNISNKIKLILWMIVKERETRVLYQWQCKKINKQKQTNKNNLTENKTTLNVKLYLKVEKTSIGIFFLNHLNSFIEKKYFD